jgi:hypothetical protein
MENPTPPSPRSWVTTVSVVASAFFGVVVFASSSASESAEDAVASLLMAGWVALPLLLLGVVKIFRAFPTTHVVLLVFGCFSIVWAIGSARGAGSTAALAVVVIPFYLLIIYGVTSLVLMFRKDRLK